ncbi:hypothetical protein [Agriterribacter sp.]|uniref:hypothetical protein n=1 Tax=Agriterribacter sp. TaxID=2821509 RepID=UPI002B742000|nr:hypothetical protein [Agriterribacter sp.]HRP58432.1 hypothetical protein [Agriterribacter sp.]
MNTFCTIITADYFPHALALYKSLKKFDQQALLYVLVADDKSLSGHDNETGIQILAVSQLKGYPLTQELYNKYAHIRMDFFRWSLKPILISYLLETGFKKVLFVDCDIFFFNDYRFLFEALNQSAIILTPHWYSVSPAINENEFVQLLTSGFFNAGFIGSNRNGLPALQWWANACHYKMSECKAERVYVDQRYLDLLPLLFENVQILSHKGCNLGAGNYETCKRILVGNTLLIDGEYPVVFVHFYKPLIEQILKGYDPLLVPYFNEYKKVFEEIGAPFRHFMGSLAKQLQPSVMMQLKWKLRIRTRIKALLYNLAHKL